MYHTDAIHTIPTATGILRPTNILIPKGSIGIRIIIGCSLSAYLCIAIVHTAADMERHHIARKILTTLITTIVKRTIPLATFWAERVILLVASVYCVDRPLQ